MKCSFCHAENKMIPCHGHYHCTRCGKANMECCDGEQAENTQIVKTEEDGRRLPRAI